VTDDGTVMFLVATLHQLKSYWRIGMMMGRERGERPVFFNGGIRLEQNQSNPRFLTGNSRIHVSCLVVE
jgi:hypothetical protein